MVMLNTNLDATKWSTGWIEPRCDFRDPREVASIAARFAWSPIHWAEGRRGEARFLHADWIVLDFDDGKKTVRWAMDTYHGHVGFVGTTRNHQKEKGGLTCDRFRLALLARDRCESLSTYKRTLHNRVVALGADRAAVDGARGFYPCTNIVQVFTGGFLVGWDPEPKPRNNAIEPAGAYPVPRLGGWQPTRLLQRVAAFGAPIGQRNKLAFACACDLFRAFGPAAEESVFFEVRRLIPDDGTFPDAEVRACIKSAKARI